MPVTATNVTTGPADLYWGALAAADPASPTAPIDPEVYTSLGSTDGGTTLSFTQSFTMVMVDQSTMAVDAVPETTNAQITTTLAESTLANLKVVLNGGTLTPDTAKNTLTYSPSIGTVGVSPTFVKLLLVGKAPNGKKRLVIARKCLSTEGTEMNFSKTDKTSYGVTFSLFTISDSILPVVWIDDTSTS